MKQIILALFILVTTTTLKSQTPQFAVVRERHRSLPQRRRSPPYRQRDRRETPKRRAMLEKMRQQLESKGWKEVGKGGEWFNLKYER